MLELNDYLSLSAAEAARQWKAMLGRNQKKRQDDFTPVETLLTFGLGQLGNVSPAGNVNIAESDPTAKKLAAIGRRPTKSISAKLGNLANLSNVGGQSYQALEIQRRTRASGLLERASRMPDPRCCF